MSEIHSSKCECPGGYDGDPHVFCQWSGHGDVSEIHFSKCECPGGYNGDPYRFFSMFWLWRMCLKSNFANCECPSGYDGDPPDFMNKYGLKKCKRIVC